MPEDTEDNHASKRERIRTAADIHGVDLDHAITGMDNHPDSDRIYIIEDMRTNGYRIISYGMNAEGKAASEQPIHISKTAVGTIQGLLHAAGMHVVERLEREKQITLRDTAEMMELSEPLEPQEDEPRATWEDEGDADSEEGDR